MTIRQTSSLFLQSLRMILVRGFRSILQTREDSLERWLVRLITFGAYTTAFLALTYYRQAYFAFGFPRAIALQIIIELMTAVWLVLVTIQPKYRPDWRQSIVLAAGLWLGALFLSLPDSVDRVQSWWSSQERMMGVFMSLHLFAFFLVLSTVFRTWALWRRFFQITLIGAALAGLYALFQVVQYPGQIARVSGIMGNPLFLSSYLVLPVFFGFVLWFQESRSAFRALYLGVSGFLLSIIVLTASRGVLLAVLITAVFALVFYFWRRPSLAKKTLALLVLALVGLILAVTAFQLKPPAGITRFSELFTLPIARLLESGLSGGDRFALWQIGWQGFLKRPLFGWGPENFGILFDAEYKIALGSRLPEIWYDRAHNQIVDIFALTGMVGGIAYLALWVVIFLALWQALKGDNGLQGSAVRAVVAGLAAYFLQNLTLFDMPLSALMFWATAAFVSALKRGFEVETPSKNAMSGKTVSIPIIASVIAGCLWLVFVTNLRPFWKSVQGATALRANQRNAFSASNRMREALNSNSFTNQEFRLELARIVFNALSSKTLDATKKREILQFGLHEMEAAYTEHPKILKNILLLSWMYRWAAKEDISFAEKAENLLIEGRGTYPNRPELMLTLAEVQILQKNFSHADEWNRRLLETAPEYLKNEVLLQAARLALFRRDQKLALRFLREAERRGHKIYQDRELVRVLAETTPWKAVVPDELIQYLDYAALTTQDPEIMAAQILFHRKIGDSKMLKVFNMPLSTSEE